MKSFTVLLCAAVLALAFVPAKGYYDDDSYQKRRQCENKMEPCVMPLIEKYIPGRHPPLDVIAGKIEAVGARGVCRDLIQAAECILQTFSDPVCAHIQSREFDETRILAIKAQQIILDYVCVDRIDDLEAHFSCLTSWIPDEEHFEYCGREIYSSVQQCSIDDAASCITPIFLTNEQCDTGAVNLLKEVANRGITLLPHCSSHNLFGRMMSAFFRK